MRAHRGRALQRRHRERPHLHGGRARRRKPRAARESRARQAVTSTAQGAAGGLTLTLTLTLTLPLPLIQVELKEPLAADAFVALIPDSCRQRMDVHNASVQEMLRWQRSSQDAEDAASRLRELRLPSELDVVTQADKHLPPHTKAKVEAAKNLGDVAALDELRLQCESKEANVNDLLALANGVRTTSAFALARALACPDRRARSRPISHPPPTPLPRAVRRVRRTSSRFDHPNLSAVALQSLRSTYQQACRSAVSDAAERLRKSVEVTKGLSTRMTPRCRPSSCANRSKRLRSRCRTSMVLRSPRSCKLRCETSLSSWSRSRSTALQCRARECRLQRSAQCDRAARPG